MKKLIQTISEYMLIIHSQWIVMRVQKRIIKNNNL